MNDCSLSGVGRLDTMARWRIKNLESAGTTNPLGGLTGDLQTTGTVVSSAWCGPALPSLNHLRQGRRSFSTLAWTGCHLKMESTPMKYLLRYLLTCCTTESSQVP